MVTIDFPLKPLYQLFHSSLKEIDRPQKTVREPYNLAMFVVDTLLVLLRLLFHQWGIYLFSKQHTLQAVYVAYLSCGYKQWLVKFAGV